jgi:hypothetical protein
MALLAGGCGREIQVDPGVPERAAREQAAVPSNRPPVIERLRLEPADPGLGERLAAKVAVADPDGDDVSLAYTWTLDGERYGNSEPSLVVPVTARGALVALEVTPYDGKAEGEPARVAARVRNRPPRLEEVLLEPAKDVSVLDEIVASPRASDPDGDPVEFRFSWRVNGRELKNTEGRLAPGSYARGDRVELEVTAFDGDDFSEPLRSPPIEVVNSPPRITSAPSGLNETGVFDYAIQVADPDDDRRMRYRLVEGPKGMSIDWLAGRVTWTPSVDQTGSHPVVIEADDQAGRTHTQSFELEVSAAQDEGEGAEAAEAAAPAAAAP